MFKAAIAAVAALGLAAGTASAQYPTVVPHRGHYHVVPAYSPPVYGGYSYPTYSPGVVLGGYSSPGVTLGGYSSSPAPVIGGYYGSPTPYYGGFAGYGGTGDIWPPLITIITTGDSWSCDRPQGPLPGRSRSSLHRTGSVDCKSQAAPVGADPLPDEAGRVYSPPFFRTLRNACSTDM